MSNSKTAATRSVGRPRSFDEGAALDAAMELFWRNGYAAVSVPELCAVTGLSTSSLYNTFGSKLDLYEKALARYCEMIGEVMLGPLREGTAGLADVEAYLDRLATMIHPKRPQGCMAINSISEFRHPSPGVSAWTAWYRRELRESLRAALTRAATAGEIPANTVDPRVDTLVPMVIAGALLVASEAPIAEIRDLLRAARAVALG